MFATESKCAKLLISLSLGEDSKNSQNINHFFNERRADCVEKWYPHLRNFNKL